MMNYNAIIRKKFEVKQPTRFRSVPSAKILIFLFFYQNKYYKKNSNSVFNGDNYPLGHNFLPSFMYIKRVNISRHFFSSSPTFERGFFSANSIRALKCKDIFLTGCSLNIVFFRRNLNILLPFPRKDRAAIDCTENGKPIRVTVHSDLRSDELISYMQSMHGMS